MKRDSMKKTTLFLLVAIATLVMMAIGAMAQPQNLTAGELTAGAAETRTGAGVTANISVEGGNITELNISTELQSGWWQGIWGSLELNLTLEDATGNVFYNWGSTGASSGEVYFSNDSIVVWSQFATSGVVNATIGNTTYAQTTYGWANVARNDNLTNTYKFGLGHQAFGITGGNSFNANTTPAVNLAMNSGVLLNATMLWQNASNPLGAGIMNYPLFAALVTPNVASFKSAGQLNDFAVLLPTRSDSGTETYFVYTELS